MKASTNDATGLLQAWTKGDESVQKLLSDLIFVELKRRARVVKERSHAIMARTLIQDVFLSMVNQNRIQPESRITFCALAAPMMRRAVLEDARSRYTPRRIPGRRNWMLLDTAVFSNDQSSNFIAFDEILHLLSKIDPVKAEVVELRFYGGLSIEEIAWKLDLTSIIVRQQWNLAKAWIQQKMQMTGTRSFLGPLHSRASGPDLLHEHNSVIARLAKRQF